MSAPSPRPNPDRNALSAADLLSLASHLSEIREIVSRLDPAVRNVLTDMLRDVAESDQSAERGPNWRKFGAFAGQFDIGPEFFEPLPDDELRAWGEK